MKKITSLLVFTSIFALASCGSTVKKDSDDPSTDVKVTSVSLNTNQASMFVNETLELSASVLPTNATNKNITWESSNSEYATVLNGVVSALKEGNVTITARSNENNNLFDSCYITISTRGDEDISVSEVTLDKNSLTLEVGDSETLVATVLPQDATNKNVTWKSNDTSVATVNNGVVTAKAAGSTKVIVTSVDGAKTAECTVTVNPKVVNVTGVKLDKTSASISVNESVTLVATVLPENATNKAVTWSSNDNNVATVENGSVRGKSAGSAVITVTTVDGSFEAKCTVTVKNNVPEVINVTGVNLDETSIELEVGDAQALTATVSPDNATNKSVTWSSNNTSVATVNDGFVSAQSSGTAKITVTTVDGNKTATCNVTVKEKAAAVTSVKLDQSSIELEVGKTQTLKATVSPDNATNKNVSWTSSKTTVATVSGGVVTAKAVGTTTITVKTEDGNKTATCSVTVKAATVAVTGVSLNNTSLDLTEGETSNLVATVSPSNATNKNVSWSSDKTTVATVDNGLVTAKGEGTANITVKTEDGNKTATCVVTVSKVSDDAWVKVTSISDLISGDTIVFASSANTVAGALKSNSNKSTYYLESLSGSTFVNDKITKLASGAQEFDVSITGSKYTFTSSSGVLGATADKKLTLNDTTYNTWTVSISNGSATITNVNQLYGSIKYNASTPRFCNYTSSSGTAPIIYRAPRTPIVPTGVSIGGNIELAPGDTKALTVTYTPAKANTDLDLTWSSSNTSVATVTDGTVEVKSTAAVGSYTDITATLKRDTSIKSTIRVTVVEETRDAYTIMMYICGADLESQNGFATSDIKEILSVSNQPDDVNIIMETGGARSWNSTYGISASELGRYSVSNKKLNKVTSVSKANMGSSSTLQSFITWGVQNYPADKIALILWNHGGAMRGVCYDELNSDDSLLNSEVKTALSNSFNTLGRSTSEKFEWIGYDACLMQVQDIAEFNSTYFNYMVGSEESEAGEGWDYDTWVDDLYAHKSTETILNEIVDGFIADTNSMYSSYGWGSSDQTLSWLDLSAMSAYKTAWEAMASKLSTLSINKSSFQSMAKGVKYYGSDDQVKGYSYFGVFDAKDFLNKLKSNYSGASTEITEALNAFANLVKYSKKGSGAGNSNGLCCFFPMKDGSGYTCEKSTYYSTSQTNFTNWRSIVNSYGD